MTGYRFSRSDKFLAKI